jgi:transposase-like protein
MEAKRYTQGEKDAVVNFVLDHDKKHGRGGKSQAVKKFKVNPVTVAKWMKAAGHGPKGSKPKARATAAKPAPSSGTPVETLKRMLDIQGKLGSLRAEYDQLKATL